MTVRQFAPSADGLTQPSIVSPLVMLSDALLLTVTRLLVPLNVSADPYLPAAVRVALASVPLLPLPELSVIPVPDVSSKPQAPTRPAPLTGGLTVNVTVIVFGEPVAPGAVTVTFPL